MSVSVVALALLIVVPFTVVLIRKSFHALGRIVIFFSGIVIFPCHAACEAVLVYSVGVRLAVVSPTERPIVLVGENDSINLFAVHVEYYILICRSVFFRVIVIVPHLSYGIRYGRLYPCFRARALRLYYRRFADRLSVLRLARYRVVFALAKHHVVFPVDVLHVAVPLVIPAGYLRGRSIPDVVLKTFLELCLIVYRPYDRALYRRVVSVVQYARQAKSVLRRKTYLAPLVELGIQPLRQQYPRSILRRILCRYLVRQHKHKRLVTRWRRAYAPPYVYVIVRILRQVFLRYRFRRRVVYEVLLVPRVLVTRALRHARHVCSRVDRRVDRLVDVHFLFVYFLRLRRTVSVELLVAVSDQYRFIFQADIRLYVEKVVIRPRVGSVYHIMRFYAAERRLQLYRCRTVDAARIRYYYAVSYTLPLKSLR